ncbi:MAG: hypothetical protein HC906_15040 [Bacteroidales bacterium]|nr:hypothetical protein [Bacteroidales bacterium]
MTDWSARELTFDLSSLPVANPAKIQVWQDGINAHQCGIDYKKTELTVNKNEKITIKLAPGGGWVGRIE